MFSFDDAALGVPAPLLFPLPLARRLEQETVVAVITIERAEDAVPLARALVDGGVRGIELAWRTAGTLAALTAIKREVPEMLIGAGTLLSKEQVRAVTGAGADFGVSPGFSAPVVREASRCGLPFAPGVQTASEVQVAIEHGCRWLKFFPAESAGGLAHLRSLHAPFAHLGLRYIALGGITEANAMAYLSEPSVGAIGGSWIAPAALVRERAWDLVQQRARAVRTMIERLEKRTAT